MRQKLAWLALAAIVLAALPFPLSEPHTVELATVGAYFIAILGVDLLGRHAGEVSLGHGGFMAVGAYTTATLTADHGVRDLWTIPAAAAVAGGVGLLAGLPGLRVSGLSFALASFGIAVAAPTTLRRFDHLTGGSRGIALFGKSTQTGHGLGVLGLTNGQWLYALTWTVGVACFLVLWAILASSFGRSLHAVRDSELAAAAAGVNRPAVKLAAFGISAALAGIAGSLLAIDVAYVSPHTFPIQLSLYLLVGSVAGLYGSIWGAVLGALLVQYLSRLVGLVPHVDTSRAGPATFFFGATLVALMLALPLVLRSADAVARRCHARPH
jgi:branched-chain amino acid transport system permease protein